MAVSKVDQEAFLQWREQLVTKWVLERLQVQAQETAQLAQDSLWAQLPADPDQWRASQPLQAHRKGLADGYMHVVTLEYADVREETAEEIAELEKKARD